MFESLVVGLLNKHLSPYLEGLDSEQLNIGIWKGNIVLENLSLKPEVLEDLNLPIRIVSGYIGALTLKIPWKKLFPTPSAPVEAKIDEIFLILGPRVDQVYDEEKEKALAEATKQRQIAAAEEEKKAALLSEEDKKESASFTTKLVTSIINNLQVSIGNVHIRYEDASSNPEHPFSAGLTLSRLDLQSTDENWFPTFLKGMPTFVHKLIEMNSLSIYWNSSSEMFGQLDEDSRQQKMRELISTSGMTVESVQYIIAPLSLDVRAVLNTKGEAANAPKVDASLSMDRFEIDFDEDQYEDVLYITDATSRFSRQQNHLHLRPSGSPDTKEGQKKWWNYAIHSTLEDIHKKHEVWTWDFISDRRDKRVAYIELYTKILNTTKPDKNLAEQLVKVEEDISFEDIMRYRKIAEDRMPKKEEKEESGGWLSGWFGGGKKKKKEADPLKMTEEQRKAFYGAIGYSEGTVVQENATEAYVATVVKFDLLLSAVKLFRGKRKAQRLGRPEPGDDEILSFKSFGIQVEFKQRPGGEAIELDASVDKMMISAAQDDTTCILVQPRKLVQHVKGTMDDSIATSAMSELILHFETNPMDKRADSVVSLVTQPVEVTYIPEAVEPLIAFFEKPQGLMLDEIASAAASGASFASEQGKASLIYAIEKHKTIALDISLGAPTIVVPSPKDGIALVLDLGRLLVRSQLTPIDNTKLEDKDVTDFEEKMYDIFTIEIEDIQAILGKGENIDTMWREALASDLVSTPLHILQKTTLSLTVKQCVQQDNIQFPKLICEGSLGGMRLLFSDTKNHTLMALLKALAPPAPPSKPKGIDEKKKAQIPLAAVAGTSKWANKAKNLQRELKGMEEESNTDGTADIDLSASFVDPPIVKSRSASMYSEFSDADFHSLPDEDAEAKLKMDEGMVDRVEIRASFVCDYIGVIIHESTEDPNVEAPLLEICVKDFVLENFSKRTFDMAAAVTLGSFEIIDHFQSTSDHTQYVIDGGGAVADLGTADESSLIRLNYISVDEKSPEFGPKHNFTKQAIEFSFGHMRICACDKTLAKLTEFEKKLMPATTDDGTGITEIKEDDVEVDANANVDDDDDEYVDADDTIVADGSNADRNAMESAPLLSGGANSAVIDIHLKASFGSLGVHVYQGATELAALRVAGGEAEVSISEVATKVTSQLAQLYLRDISEPSTLYPDILTVEGDRVFDMTLILFSGDSPYRGPLEPDIDVDLTLTAFRIVFLNKFVNKMLSFTNGLSPPEASAAAASAAAEAAAAKASDLSADEEAKQAAAGTKLKIKMNVSAPKIIVPVHSESDRVLFANLGAVEISNSLDFTSPSDREHIVDVTTVDLTDVQLFFANLQAEEESNQVDIIRPISIKTILTRQLNEVISHDNPSTTLVCQMDDIKIDLHDTSAAELFAISNGNLTEGVIEEEPLPAQPAKAPEEVSEGNEQQEDELYDVIEDDDEEGDRTIEAQDYPEIQPDDQGDASDLMVPRDKPDEPSKATKAIAAATTATVHWITTKATVTMDNMQVTLLAQERPLAGFGLDEFVVKATIHSDGAMVVKTTIKSFSLGDLRDYSPKHFPTMLDRCQCCLPEQGNPDESALVSASAMESDELNSSSIRHKLLPVVTVSFTQYDEDQAIVVNLNYLRLTVCPDFLNALQAFGASLAEQTSTPSQSSSDSDISDDEGIDETPEDIPEDAVAKNAAAKPTPEKTGRTKIYIAINDLRLTVIADHTKAKPAAIYLVLDSTVSMMMDAETQVIEASIGNMRIESYRPDKPSDQFVTILEPTDIEAGITTIVKTGEQTIDAVSEKMVIKFGYRDLATITAVQTAMTGDTVEEAEKPKISDNWGVHPVKSRPWFLKRMLQRRHRSKLGKKHVSSGLAGKLSLYSGFSTGSMDGYQRSSATLGFECIDFVLNDDATGVTQPLLLTTMSLVANARGFGAPLTKKERIRVNCVISLVVASYNPLVSAWEPLVEPEIDEKTNSLEPFSLQVTVVKARPALENPDEEENEEGIEVEAENEEFAKLPGLSCTITTEKIMQMTLTQGFLRTITACSFVAAPQDKGPSDIPTDVPTAVQAIVAHERKETATLLQDGFAASNNKFLFSGYTVKNFTGNTLCFAEKGVELQDRGVSVESGKSAALVLNKQEFEDETHALHALSAHSRARKRIMHFQIDGWSEITHVGIDTIGCTSHKMLSKDQAGILCTVVVDVSLEEATKIITIRSSFQIQNSMPIPLEIAFDMPDGQGGSTREMLDTVLPKHTYAVPIVVAYLPGIHVRPAGLAYEWSSDLLTWRGSAKQSVHCPQLGEEGAPPPKSSSQSSNTNGTANGVNEAGADVEDEIVSHAVLPAPSHSGGPFQMYSHAKNETYLNCKRPPTGPHHTLVISPPVAIRNLLPFPIEIDINSSSDIVPQVQLELESTKKIPVHTTTDSNVTVRVRCKEWGGEDSEWSKPAKIYGKKVAKEIVLISRTGANLRLAMKTRNRDKDGKGAVVTIYAPYWIINKTDLPINIKQNNKEGVFTSDPLTETTGKISLFSFGSTSMLKSKRAQVQVSDSKWSDDLNIDTAGHSGIVKCSRENGQGPIELAMNVYLAEGQMTKIVTFRPRFMIWNHASYEVECFETFEDTKVSHLVEPNTYIPFWPVCNEKRLALKLPNALEEPPALDYEQPVTVPLCSLYDSEGVRKFRSVDFSVRSDKACLVLHISENDGHADVRIENRCEDVTISFNQLNNSRKHKLQPKEMMLYCRDNPMGDMTIQWQVEDDSDTHEVGFREFGCKNIAHGTTKELIYSICFPDQGQVVLILTQDEIQRDRIVENTGLIKTAYANAYVYENFNVQMKMELAGIGLSLVNGKPQEIAYFCIRGQEAWERLLPEPDAFADDWGRLKASSIDKIKHARNLPNPPDSVKLSDKVEVLLGDMLLYMEKDMPSAPLRSRVAPGLVFEYADTENHIAMKVAIDCIQLDNKLEDTMVPVILNNVIPGRGAVRLPVIKFIFVQAKPPPHAVETPMMVQRMTFLMQKINLHVTERFLLKVADFANFAPTSEAKADITNDVDFSRKPIFNEEWAIQVASGGKQYWKIFQIHPLSINVSFSLAAMDDDEDEGEDNFVRNLLEVVGVAVSNISGVPLKLNCLMMENVYSHQDELVNSITTHYTSEGMKEIYKVLGCLEFIGNPVRSFNHLSTGFTDLFYEPNADGVLSAATGTLSSATSAVASITGTVGNTLAALSMDEDYKRERQMAAARRKTVGDHLAYGGERFARGLIEGVGGLIFNPLEGAKKGGAAGFVKGIGRGLLGVVAKPVGGIIDMTTSALDVVDLARRKTQGELDVEPIRLARYVQSDKVVGVYSAYDASGEELLRALVSSFEHKISFMGHSKPDIAFDKYLVHFVISDGKKRQIVIFTDVSVILMPTNALETIFRVPLSGLKDHKIVKKGIELTIPDASGKKKKKKTYLLPEKRPKVAKYLDDTITKNLEIFERKSY